MSLGTRKILDKSFTLSGYFSLALMIAAVAIILGPITYNGLRAMIFRGTIEHRKVLFTLMGHGNEEKLQAEIAQTDRAREPVYAMLQAYKDEIAELSFIERRQKNADLNDILYNITHLFGPSSDTPRPILIRDRFGATRADLVQQALHNVLYYEEWDYSCEQSMGTKIYLPRSNLFENTALAPLFPYIEENIDAMMRPRWTFYWRFLTERSFDAHFFGGIMPEIRGTFYLTLGAMIFALPIGILAAIYLTEYARDTHATRFIRTCMSTLAGVPSIVFGLFGLAFFINTLRVSPAKSVLAGSLTLALLILPTIVRAAEEAIRAVPHTYKEAAMGLGASKWHTIITIILPAALPGILTGVVISMGRAAGETAPIIFTAAVSVGRPLRIFDVFTQPTPALSWNIYNLATEHEAAEYIRHVQYGMVFVLVALVVLLNVSAILIRARIAKRLKT